IVNYYFFFSQAEDGIRDRNVTGVQTCALPIFLGEKRYRPQSLLPLSVRSSIRKKRNSPEIYLEQASACRPVSNLFLLKTTVFSRSEERRVGKERTYRW